MKYWNESNKIDKQADGSTVQKLNAACLLSHE